MLSRTLERHGWRGWSAQGWLERVRRGKRPPPPESLRVLQPRKLAIVEAAFDGRFDHCEVRRQIEITRRIGGVRPDLVHPADARSVLLRLEVRQDRIAHGRECFGDQRAADGFCRFAAAERQQLAAPTRRYGGCWQQEAREIEHVLQVVRVSDVCDDEVDYARAIQQELRSHGVRAELDASNDHIKAKIANAEQMKVHTMLVIGNRDMEANAVSVRVHGKGNLGAKPRDQVIADLLRSIADRAA